MIAIVKLQFLLSSYSLTKAYWKPRLFMYLGFIPLKCKMLYSTVFMLLLPQCLQQNRMNHHKACGSQKLNWKYLLRQSLKLAISMTVPVGQSSYSLSLNWYCPLLFLNPALAQDLSPKLAVRAHYVAYRQYGYWVFLQQAKTGYFFVAFVLLLQPKLTKLQNSVVFTADVSKTIYSKNKMPC